MISPNQIVSPSSVADFAEHLRQGAKRREERRCGLETELFGYDRADLSRLGAARVQGVMRKFCRAADRLYGEGETFPTELCVEGLGHLTIEPGGQLEFSGKPAQSLHAVGDGLKEFFARLRALCAEEGGTIFLAAGFDPLRRLDEQRWFPKRRYDLMRPYLASRGARGWDMMTRTCAVQINLDYESERDFSRKFITGNRLAPIVTAIFANSPFAEGKLSGYKSTRAAAWLETDDARCGLSPLAVAESCDFAEFVDYAKRLPMIFVRRGGRYSGSLMGTIFADHLRGGGDVAPVFQDWTDHLSAIFTDARLKQYLEFRSADGGNVDLALALAALWKGLFYDDEALDCVSGLMPSLSLSASVALRESVAREALAAQSESIDVLPLAKEVVRIAVEGLSRVAPDEVHYLDVIRNLVLDDECAPADVLLRNWHGSWHGSIERAIEYLRVA